MESLGLYELTKSFKASSQKYNGVDRNIKLNCRWEKGNSNITAHTQIIYLL